ncbi:class I SAM-dependent methyltransferase [Opitutaceae bacterium]|nr:class I SAM-dependent methyltransferase [Opitutaceae bacterium]
MSFDRIAPHYRWLEPVLAGGVLQEARLAHVAVLDGAENILLVGEGPGHFLTALRQRRPDVPITVIDSSRRMLDLAATATAGPTRFIQLDLTNTPLPEGQWDGIVTHCFLDCFNPTTLGGVVDRIVKRATPDADWLITDFALPSGGWRRTRARLIHALMYRTFRLTTGLEARRWTDPSPLLRTHGFKLSARIPLNHGLIVADHWQKRLSLSK